MTAIDARPNSIAWPPLVFIGAAALAVVMAWLVPLPWLPRALAEFLFAFGWLVVLGGFAITVTAVRAMRAAHTPIAANRAAEHLVTSGPFSFTRNPIYLSAIMMLFGIGLITGNPWFFAAALLAAFAVQKLAIESEERHLEMRFGKRFRDYAKRVRRWI